MYEHFYDFCGINQTAGFNYISSATWAMYKCTCILYACFNF
jgi:hypothetical protein